MHPVAVRRYDGSNIQLIWFSISWGGGKSSSMTNGQNFILNLYSVLKLSASDHAWGVVQVCKSLSLLSNLNLLGEQLIRPCFFHAYQHFYPFYQFDFITSSWKNSFQPSSSCLQSMHPNLKTILLKCAFCHQKEKKKKSVFCRKMGLLCTSAEQVLCPTWGLH